MHSYAIMAIKRISITHVKYFTARLIAYQKCNHFPFTPIFSQFTFSCSFTTIANLSTQKVFQ